MKLFVNNEQKRKISNIYYQIRTKLLNNKLTELENDIYEYYVLINELYNNKFIVDVEVSMILKNRKKDFFTFGETLRLSNSNYKIVIYLSEIIKYQKYLSRKNEYDIDTFIFETILNIGYHEFIHFCQLEKIKKSFLDKNTFINTITYILENKKYNIDYYDNTLEIEAHYKSFCFLNEISTIVNKQKMCFSSSIQLNNIFIYLISNLDSVDAIYSKYDYLFGQLYMLKKNDTLAFNNCTKKNILLNKIFDNNHNHNFNYLIYYYANNKTNKDIYIIYSYILLYEIKFLTKEEIENNLLKIINVTNFDKIYELFSNIYDSLIDQYNSLYIKYKLCFYIAKNKKFINQTNITDKELTNRLYKTYEYIENKVNIIKFILHKIESLNRLVKKSK